eukprot:3026377-Pleurochrysis_carterae.AAC.3
MSMRMGHRFGRASVRLRLPVRIPYALDDAPVGVDIRGELFVLRRRESDPVVKVVDERATRCDVQLEARLRLVVARFGAPLGAQLEVDRVHVRRLPLEQRPEPSDADTDA